MDRAQSSSAQGDNDPTATGCTSHADSGMLGSRLGWLICSHPAQHHQQLTANTGLPELHLLRDPQSREACAHNTGSTGKRHAGMLLGTRPRLQGHTATPGFSRAKPLLPNALLQEIKSLFSLKPDHKNKSKETEHLCVPLLVEIQAACRAEVAWSHQTLGPGDLGTSGRIPNTLDLGCCRQRWQPARPAHTGSLAFPSFPCCSQWHKADTPAPHSPSRLGNK